MQRRSDGDATRFPDSFVGIFWAIQEQGAAASIEDHRCPLKQAEPYGTIVRRQRL
jgi:hypothetical protein